MEKHISVLLSEAISGLAINDDGVYVDMTLGFAGHSSQILKSLKTGTLYAFDKDKDAINYSKEQLKKISNNFKVFNTGFVNMKKVLENEEITKVNGFLFDLGVSSVEIDVANRGFSYMKDAKLDMRMDQDAMLTAHKVVNEYDYHDLVRIFREYGEEKYAGKIAKEIVFQRETKQIDTTLELVDIISRCYPYKDKRNSHPAKKVFQSIRIEVNNELGELEDALNDALNMLDVDGRIAVITFQSLEDRICKKLFKKVTEIDPVIKGMPNAPKDLLPDYELVTKKPILPSKEEIEFNKRSAPAKLRIIKRIK